MKNVTKTPPSIFNDVIGPVMRGPSSSHCAAALRIGRMVQDLMRGDLATIDVTFDRNGSLATTHQTQGSDMGLCGGLLALDITDERLKDAEKLLTDSGISLQVNIEPLSDAHPNTYNIHAKGKSREHQIKAISTGGGIVEIISIDGIEVSIAGDYYETLLFCHKDDSVLVQFITAKAGAEDVAVHSNNLKVIIEIKSAAPLAHELINEIQSRSKYDISEVASIAPVLPVLSRKDMYVPFLNATELITYNTQKKRSLGQLAVYYESQRGNIPEPEVMHKMSDIVEILTNAITQGLTGTEYADRILGYQSGGYAKMLEAGGLLDIGMLNRMTMYVTALMEIKSSMGIIVAAPTAGACGGLPGAIIGAAHSLKSKPEQIIRAMLAAGLIGVFITHGATFAAEVAGCQAETGAGAAMAAAGLVELAGGTAEQALSAASLALQNTFGMTCDPIANRVEAPCLGKNIMAAANAVTCANMALADFNALIPLDEVIQAMYLVGTSLPHELRCTALGGLSITKTAKKIEQELLQNKGKKDRRQKG